MHCKHLVVGIYLRLTCYIHSILGVIDKVKEKLYKCNDYVIK